MSRHHLWSGFLKKNRVNKEAVVCQKLGAANVSHWIFVLGFSWSCQYSYKWHGCAEYFPRVDARSSANDWRVYGDPVKQKLPQSVSENSFERVVPSEYAHTSGSDISDNEYTFGSNDLSCSSCWTWRATGNVWNAKLIASEIWGRKSNWDGTKLLRAVSISELAWLNCSIASRSQYSLCTTQRVAKEPVEWLAGLPGGNNLFAGIDISLSQEAAGNTQ